MSREPPFSAPSAPPRDRGEQQAGQVQGNQRDREAVTPVRQGAHVVASCPYHAPTDFEPSFTTMRTGRLRKFDLGRTILAALSSCAF